MNEEDDGVCLDIVFCPGCTSLLFILSNISEYNQNNL
jgi:hypothetical protein